MSGARAKRAATEFLREEDGCLAKLARVHGCEPEHVKYYVRQFKGTQMESFIKDPVVLSDQTSLTSTLDPSLTAMTVEA